MDAYVLYQQYVDMHVIKHVHMATCLSTHTKNVYLQYANMHNIHMPTYNAMSACTTSSMYSWKVKVHGLVHKGQCAAADWENYA